MNSQQIEYFLSAVKHLNFTMAAEEHSTSQPTISRQIALLEEELGFELFRRFKSGLRLTAGGAIMAQEFKKSNQIISDAITRVELISDGLDGELSIGYFTAVNTDRFIYPPTFAFMSQYPSIRVAIESMSFSGIRSRLDTGEFDIIFTLNTELPSFNDIDHLDCYDVSAIIAMSSTHHLAKKEGLCEKDFCGQTFLLPTTEESQYLNEDALKTLSKIGITGVTLRHMNSVESMLIGIRSGVGVSLLDSSSDLLFDSRYRCFRLPPEQEFKAVVICAIWKKNNINPIVPIYIEMLKENLEL